MLQSMRHIRSVLTVSQRTINVLSSAQSLRTFKSHGLASLSTFTNTRRTILQPNHQNHRLSVRNFNQVDTDGKDNFDIDSLFSDEVEPSYFDETDEYQRNYEAENTFAKSLDKIEYEISDLNNFSKSLYNENSITANRSKEEIDHYYKSHSIQVSGHNPPNPVLSFEEIDFPDEIITSLKRKFDKPTPIQSITWPVTLSGRNVIGIAQTGSGKTLSFLAPALMHIHAQQRPNRGEGPIALVLCPTRELAKQCESVAKSFFAKSIRTTCLFGGGERAIQLRSLSQGCDLAIATPGRLIDLLKSRELRMNQCSFVVLDEADRMLDMGFEPQIRGIIDQIRPDRQITMWSATWPKEVRELASRYLRSADEPVQIKVGSSELIANKDVEQQFHICQSVKKNAAFFELVKKTFQDYKEQNTSNVTDAEVRRRSPRILVFANQKRTCDVVASWCRQSGVRAESLHGDHTQRQRDYVMQGFRRGNVPLMVATDVAARGIDVDDIDYVINFDAPLTCVTYIHRIGRTGRGGKRGTSITILTEMDGAIIPGLIKNLNDIGHPVEEKLLKMGQWWDKKKNTMKRRTLKSRDSWDGGHRNNRYGRRSEGRNWDDETDSWNQGNKNNQFRRSGGRDWDNQADSWNQGNRNNQFRRSGSRDWDNQADSWNEDGRNHSYSRKSWRNSEDY